MTNSIRTSINGNTERNVSPEEAARNVVLSQGAPDTEYNVYVEDFAQASGAGDEGGKVITVRVRTSPEFEFAVHPAWELNFSIEAAYQI